MGKMLRTIGLVSALGLAGCVQEQQNSEINYDLSTTNMMVGMTAGFAAPSANPPSANPEPFVDTVYIQVPSIERMENNQNTRGIGGFFDLDNDGINDFIYSCGQHFSGSPMRFYWKKGVGNGEFSERKFLYQALYMEAIPRVHKRSQDCKKD